MSICKSCGKEVNEITPACIYCGAQTENDVKRPMGLTIIAALILIGAFFSIIGLLSLKEADSIVLGMKVPVVLTQIITAISILIAIYCGIGFLKLKSLARTVYIYYSIWGIANQITATILMTSMLQNNRDSSGLSDAAYVGAVIGGVAGGIFVLAVTLYILYYVISRKKFFVN